LIFGNKVLRLVTPFSNTKLCYYYALAFSQWTV